MKEIKCPLCGNQDLEKKASILPSALTPIPGYSCKDCFVFAEDNDLLNASLEKFVDRCVDLDIEQSLQLCCLLPDANMLGVMLMGLVKEKKWFDLQQLESAFRKYHSSIWVLADPSIRMQQDPVNPVSGAPCRYGWYFAVHGKEEASAARKSFGFKTEQDNFEALKATGVWMYRGPE